MASALVCNGDVLDVAPFADAGETLPPQAVLSYHFSPNTEAQVQVRAFRLFLFLFLVTHVIS